MLVFRPVTGGELFGIPESSLLCRPAMLRVLYDFLRVRVRVVAEIGERFSARRVTGRRLTRRPAVVRRDVVPAAFTPPATPPATHDR
jgi:hypothetical protein